MSILSHQSRLRLIFGNNTTSIVDTFGPLLEALATLWHSEKPPKYNDENKFAWSGRTDVDTIYNVRAPDIPPEVATSPLLHFYQMVGKLASSPGTVPERAQHWVDTGCTAVLCYIKCWDPASTKD
jgi:hypothetical protein